MTKFNTLRITGNIQRIKYLNKYQGLFCTQLPCNTDAQYASDKFYIILMVFPDLLNNFAVFQ